MESAHFPDVEVEIDGKLPHEACPGLTRTTAIHIFETLRRSKTLTI